jgi:RND superfamily putative drug exporter
MFGAIARFDIRFRWLIVAVWIAGTVAGVSLLPSLSSVTNSNNSSFLPASASSQQAAALAAPFQGGNAGATATIVAARAAAPLTAADNAAFGRVEHAAAKVAGVTLVRDQGESADGQARKALVVTAPAVGQANAGDPGLVAAVRAAFTTAGAPAGLSFHLTGPLAQATDAKAANTTNGNNIRKFTLIFVIVLLFGVFRAVLAPLAVLAPAVAALLLAGPLIGQAGQAGMPVSVATGELLVVLLLGAGADYGLFLVFRLREEIRHGLPPRQALVAAMSRVGEAITFSAATVIAALSCLALASFGLYQGLGPALALGLAVMLAAALTLLPALLAIFGRALFWPSHPAAGQQTAGAWGRLAARVVRRPVPVLAAGVALFGALAAGLAGFTTGGFTSGGTTAGSDSAAGAAMIAAHFPAASNNPDSLLLRYAAPVWDHPADLTTAARRLADAPGMRAVTGPLDPGGTPMSAAELASLHARLGPARDLPATPPAGTTVPASTWQAYRATAQFISSDGRTVQFYALPAAGQPGSPAAIASIPSLRAALTVVARATGAAGSGITGQDAASYDIGHYSTTDLQKLVPIVLAVIALLLALLLRSLIAPLYLIVTVGLSYLAALGFATIVFVHLGGDTGILFLIPILLFIFAMALGEDYNILLMSRIREEARAGALRDALTRAVSATGGTITSAGLILAGTFTVLGIAGGSGQASQLGYTVGFAVFLDTFFVRTLLVPAIAVLLGRWNWWPSALSRPVMPTQSAAEPAGGQTPQKTRPQARRS